MALLALLLLLAGPADGNGIALPEEVRGPIRARLRVTIPDEGAGPGRGRARIGIVVEGPAALAVQGLWLEDALAGWRIAAQTSSWSANGSARLERALDLEQVKPGVVPLPGIRLRVRPGPGLPVEEITWSDLLAEMRDAAPLVELPALPPSPWPGRARRAGVILAVLGGASALGLVWRRWRTSGEKPVSASMRARIRLEEIARGSDGPAEKVTGLVAVVRTFLEERGGLPADRSTTAELLRCLEEREDVSIEVRCSLREILEMGDLVKFAGLVPEEAHLGQAWQAARRVIEGLAGGTGQAEGIGDDQRK